MIRKKLFKILSLSLALSVSSIGFAYAENKSNLDEPVTLQIAVDEGMYKDQTEVDKLLFEGSLAKDLGEKGIYITHTSTVDDYVEVGITPYTPENAETVMKLLGKDNVKIIEGEMAVTLQYNPELNDENVDPRVVMDPADLADDSQIMEITSEPYDAENTSAPEESDADVEEDAKVVKTTSENEKKDYRFFIGLGAAVIGLGAFVINKKRA